MRSPIASNIAATSPSLVTSTVIASREMAGRGQVVGDLLRARFVDVGDDDPVAVGREPADDRFTQSRRATSDDDDPRGELGGHARAALSHRGEAAVARDDRAGRVPGAVAREEECDLGDIARGTQSSRGNVGHQHA